MSEFTFPEANPQGPIPAPNSIHSADRPAARAGRELSAYGDQTYPEASVSQHAQAQGVAQQGEPQPSDSTMFGDFQPGM